MFKPDSPQMQNLRKWILEVLPQETIVIFAQPNAPAPGKDYITLIPLTGGGKIGATDSVVIDDSGAVTVEGQRKFTLTIKGYGDNSIDQLNKLMDSLDRPSIVDLLDGFGFSVIEAHKVEDISTTIQTGFQTRANLDMIMGYAQNTEESLDAIEKVELNGTVIELP